MPNFLSANWIGSIAELQALDMTGSEDGVWIRTPVASSGGGFDWWDIGTTIDWWDVGATIDWWNIGTTGGGSGGNSPDTENWIGWTWRKNATNGLPATGGGYWIPANDGAITFSGGAGGGLTESETLAIAEQAISDRLPLDWTLGINGKPATFPPSSHTHVAADVSGVALLGHNHVAADISNLSSWLASQPIDFGQLINVSIPPSGVTSVNGDVGDIVISTASLGAAELIHNHIHTEILDWEEAVLDTVNLNFSTLAETASFNWNNLTNIPLPITNFLFLSSEVEPGFFYKNGINTMATLPSQLLLDIVGLAVENAIPGYLYFDGDNVVLESANDESLLAQIAVMVSAAWEQVRESVTYGRIPSPNFINIH